MQSWRTSGRGVEGESQNPIQETGEKADTPQSDALSAVYRKSGLSNHQTSIDVLYLEESGRRPYRR